MPHFMHQWTYKDEQVRTTILERQNRELVVQAAIEAFGGKLHKFFFCFGDFDGMSISEFPDHEAALASAMAVVAHGLLRSFKTTLLVTPEESRRAIQQAHESIHPDDCACNAQQS